VASVTTTLDDRLSQIVAQVDTWMRPYVDRPPGPASSFYRMLSYHLGWSAADGSGLVQPARTGKRLRPALAILTCEALGGAASDARGPAVAVELVHNFSLVHDDIQDESEYRHSRETVWHLWGAPQAINVGDALFALAQVALVEQLEPRRRVGEAVLRLNQTCLRLVEGQYLDLRLESTVAVSIAEYEQMIARKTAALIECACMLGALAADADAETTLACARFGHELGMAFQLQDDLLGVWGDPAVPRKPVNAPLRSPKKGRPMVFALDLARGPAREQLEQTLAGQGSLADDGVALALRLMDELGVRERAEVLVEERFGSVEQAVRTALPAGRERELLALCSQLRARVA
jgi:geranylgeranyl diphosphate synthase, type I